MFKFNFLEKIFEQLSVKLSFSDKKNKLKNSVIENNKQTGNINNVYNYNAPVSIGVGNTDELLKKSPRLQEKSIIAPYISGLELLSLTEKEIKECGFFLMDFYKKIYDKSNRELGTTKNAYNMLKGAVFAVGSENFNNLDWKRHTASSLREIIYVWGNKSLNSDFSQFYKQNDELNEDEKTILNNITKSFEYFSAVHHNNEVGIVNSLRAIKQNSSLELDDCMNKNVFIEEVISFFNCILKVAKFSKII